MPSHPLQPFWHRNSWTPNAVYCGSNRAGYYTQPRGGAPVVAAVFHWYHTEPRHSGLGWLTPAVVHRGEGPAVQRQRAAVLAAAYARHPERYAAGPPQPPALPDRVAINPAEDPP